MCQIENVEELWKEMSAFGPKGDLNIVLLGEDGAGKEYYAREIHKLRKDKEKFLLIDFEVEHSAQREQIELLVTGGPECFLKRAKTNTFFLRRLDFLDQCLLLHLQDFFREVSSFPCNKESHFMKLGILSSANSRALSSGNKALENLMAEFFVLQVQIPPLREKKIEFYDLIRKIASLSHANCMERILQVFLDYENILTSYDWPGNLDELQSWIERIYNVGDIKDKGLETLFQQKSKKKVAPLNSNLFCDSEENNRGSEECPNLIACCSYFN